VVVVVVDVVVFAAAGTTPLQSLHWMLEIRSVVRCGRLTGSREVLRWQRVRQRHFSARARN
jgi:hypothetical protein